MNAHRPRLSLIMPAYNQARYLADAIESILAQDFDDIEIVVVDDGSTDNTSEVASRFENVVLIRQENLGQAAAVNTGVAHAQGGLIGFLDSDDVMAPKTLAGRVARFDRDPDLQYSQGFVVEFVSPELDAKSVDERSRRRAIGQPAPGPLAGTTMIRREAYDRIGEWRTDVKLGAFMDWLMRARDLNLKFFQHSEILLNRRLHDDNIGLRESDSKGDYVKLLKLALDRRRKSGQQGSR